MADYQDEFWDSAENDLRVSRESAGQPAGPENIDETKPFVWSEPDQAGLTGEEVENAERLTGITHPAPEEVPAEPAADAPVFPIPSEVQRDGGIPVYTLDENAELPHDDPGDTGPKDFHVDFDFEGKYRNASDPMPLSIRREKKTGLVGGLMYGIFVICLGLIFGCLLWLGAQDVLALGHKDSEVTVSIPASAFSEVTEEITDEEGNITAQTRNVCDLDTLAEIMFDNGLIKYKQLFKLYCRFSHADRKVGAGSYTLNTKYDYRALIYAAMPGSATRVEVSVTIPEGYTLKRIFALLEEKEVCSADVLWETAATYDFDSEYDFLTNIPGKGDQYRLEGFLFPDTYFFYTQDNPVRVIGKFLDNFENKFSDTYRERAAERGYSLRDVVTIASMIEREASSHEGERDQIASVIYNRISSSNFPYLQVDATILYGMARNGDEDKKLDTAYESSYNTYLHEGLPPGPICNPGEASLRAALYPESTNYYYYALNKGDGTTTWHEFFTNYDSFLAFVNSDAYGG
ncbi:MAG: endolytic transglycosylase MltG [Oscillospiraceae bacterium]|nr:endolytic transglycosylase MltG [Oscillospiraceae bacterium]